MSGKQQNKNTEEMEIEFERVQIVDELHYLDKQIEKKAYDNEEYQEIDFMIP